MALEVKNTLEVWTPLGTSQIQLLLGDITKLPVQEKVDFIFTSAFVENYSAVRGTLIGSLRCNLNVNVSKLARNRDVDLRQQFSCWLSRPLEENVPYRRLVCFEQVAKDGVDQQLSRLFRAMMPIFNNQDTTVITPVLATGNQGKPIQEVLPAMVNAAIEWIKAGLPLRCLKIVLYQNENEDPESKTSQRNAKCLQIFDEMNQKMMKNEKKTSVNKPAYDVCLSYNESDKGLAQTVVTALKGQDPKLSVHSKPFKFKPDVLWQDEVYQVMTNSERIIPLLTPDYVNDPECLEQFSMALCCNRLKNSETVMPFYLKTCDSLPSYMSLVQYIECRPKEPSDELLPPIKDAARHVVESLSHTQTSSSSSTSSSEPAAAPSMSNNTTTTITTTTTTNNNNDDDVTTESFKKSENSSFQNDNNKVVTANNEVSPTKKKKYSIFISYSHQHKEDPTKLVEILQSLHPDMEIFFDSDGLKAGNLWQQSLYDAVENSHCLVAFLTEGYLASSVCHEEFNLATARHYTKDSFLLLPIHTGVIDKLPKCFSYLPCLDLRTEKNGLEKLAGELEGMAKQIQSTPNNPSTKFVKDKLEQQRTKQFREKFCLEGGTVIRNTATNFDVTGSAMFLFAQDCLKFAAIMSAIIKKLSPNLTLHLHPFNQLDRAKHLESSDIVVVFVSDQLVCSQSILQELHTVLCRQRLDKDNTVVYFIESEHNCIEPLYLHTLPYSIGMDDSLWKRLERSGGNRKPAPYLVDVAGMQGSYRCKASQNLALTAASHDVINTLSQRGSGSAIPYNIVNTAQIENENKGLGNPLVPANENIISLSSLNLMMSRRKARIQAEEPRPDINTATNTAKKAGESTSATTTTTKNKSPSGVMSEMNRNDNQHQNVNVTINHHIKDFSSDSGAFSSGGGRINNVDSCSTVIGNYNDDDFNDQYVDNDGEEDKEDKVDDINEYRENDGLRRKALEDAKNERMLRNFMGMGAGESFDDDDDGAGDFGATKAKRRGGQKASKTCIML